MLIQNKIRLSATSDEQLMQLFQSGREDAYTELCNRYRNRLYHFMLRFTHNHEDTEDLIQETFLRVYRSRNAYREVARFSTWLYTIASNLMRTEFKKKSRMQTFSISEPTTEESGYVYDLPDPALNPAENTQTELMLSLLRRAVSELPEDYKLLIQLREYRDLTYEEISVAVNLPMGTVKSRLNRGRAKLQETLSGMLKNEIESVTFAA
ncbi:MAG: sigma-70 family RNA polymerase sigma factor [Balneolales bacterium]|nr:sigma-70 family RNA polymerase sigma factor [Balneolales bacterium]